MIEVSPKYALDVGTPTAIASERQHDEYLAVLDRLANKERPTSEEEKYAEVVIMLIEVYEEENHGIPEASPVEVVRALMAANDLLQKDLAPILGTERIVSEILRGKRELNKGQIDKLSKRFRVSPAVFF